MLGQTSSQARTLQEDWALQIETLLSGGLRPPLLTQGDYKDNKIVSQGLGWRAVFHWVGLWEDPQRPTASR